LLVQVAASPEGFERSFSFGINRWLSSFLASQKKDIANIDQEQLQHFRKLAEFLLAQSSQQLDEALAQGKLFEVKYAKETI